MSAAALCAALATGGAAFGQDDEHPGAAVYREHCATCHDNPDATRAPSVEALGRMVPIAIRNTMVTGVMIPQAAGLSAAEIEAVSNYLGGAEDTDDGWIDAMMCPAERATPSLDAPPSVTTFGFDLQNTRQLTNEQAGLDTDDFANLELAWAIGFPRAVSMRSQSAVVGTTLFQPVGENGGRLFAFDISTSEPCIQWIYEAGVTLRSSAGFGELPDGRKAVVVGDSSGYVHAVDAATGEPIWTAQVGLFPMSVATATPVLHDGRVYAPSSQFEIMMGGQDSHECCKTHGGVVALDALTGERLWEAHTMPDAEPIRDRGDGQMIWGPSGAPIWNSPSIDVERGQLYVGTGEATSPPAHPNTDALLAIDLEDGSINWAHQATANDIFVVGCGPTSEGLNCTPMLETVYRDVDFGASTIIATSPSGQDLVLAGQKSGTVWAMDPDTGDVVWRTDIGTGGPNGGVHWGIAADDTHVYAPISNAGRPIPGQDVPDDIQPGLYAVNLEDGSIDWAFHVEASCAEEAREFTPRCDRTFGLSGAPTIIGDRIVTGGLDGRLYVLDKATGEVVWHFDTARAFETVNGVPANGGAIDNASIVAVNGTLFVNSGYGLFGTGAGNVTLAFRPAE
jgi:polyvinyl alcohol dehydrogenase (cytochrome)